MEAKNLVMDHHGRRMNLPDFFTWLWGVKKRSPDRYSTKRKRRDSNLTDPSSLLSSS